MICSRAVAEFLPSCKLIGRLLIYDDLIFYMKTNKGKFQISKEEHLGCAPRLKGVVKNLGTKPARKMKRKGEAHMRVSEIKKKLG